MAENANQALLVAGWSSRARNRDSSAGHAPSTSQLLGALSEVLMASDKPWQITRLTPEDTLRRRPTRAVLKSEFVRMVEPRAGHTILVLSAAITEHAGRPAFITDELWRQYPEDSTLPLSWLGEQLERSKIGPRLLALAVTDLCACAFEPAQLAAELARGDDLLVLCARDSQAALAQALVGGLSGHALDPELGAISLASIDAYVRRVIPHATGVLTATSRSPFFAPAPLARIGERAGYSRRLDLSTTEPTTEPGDLTGSVLPGQIAVQSELARGGFGVVYTARQLTVDRQVALKVLPQDVDPESEDGRIFLREIRAVGSLDHENIVRIYHADMTPGGRLFFVMELLRGRDLHALLRAEGPLPQPRAIALTGQLLSALTAAHRVGLVHSDIKPGNIMVVPGDGTERVVLLDFGLSRLVSGDQPAEAIGGSPGYMAPEQLRQGRVDARSDLFAVGLILYEMLTGWRRAGWEPMRPELDPAKLPDARLRAVLDRALSVTPDKRFASADAFATALSQDSSPDGSARASDEHVPTSPFRLLSTFTEADADGFFGRDSAIAALVGKVLFRRVLVYSGASGTGKTSLLRAGLMPRLRSLRVTPLYMTCRADVGDALRRTLAGDTAWPAHTTTAQLAERRAKAEDGRLVVIVDHVEGLFLDERIGDDQRAGFLADLLDLDEHLDLCVLLSIREDFLARLLSSDHDSIQRAPIVSLPPLDRASARDAIVGPLSARRLGIADDLLETLLDDLQTAGAELAPQLGWSRSERAVYPPHLQLVCSVLYDALGPDQTELTTDHYRAAGGLSAIVGEHLERVLDRELDPAQTRVARQLLLALVTAAQTRKSRRQAELLELDDSAQTSTIVHVLELLRMRGLLVPVRLDGDEPGWELVHDSLVPRVLSWADRRELSRRRAKELVRYHLRRSSATRPSLLDRHELREVRRHPQVVAELDRPDRTAGAHPLSARQLIARSRWWLRARLAVIGGVLLAVLLAIAWGVGEWLDERRRRDRNLGAIAIELAPFDWDAEHDKTVPVPADDLENLDWALFHRQRDDPESPDDKRPYPADDQMRAEPYPHPDEPGVRRQEARVRGGGPVFLRITGRARKGAPGCPPSWLKIAHLPGYADPGTTTMRIAVPTCQATRWNMVEVPAGEFYRHGVGNPPAGDSRHVQPEESVTLPRFWIDRTEVTNAAYRVYSQPHLAAITRHIPPTYPGPKAATPQLRRHHEPGMPVTFVDFFTARGYCRFLGKDLPSGAQWEKAARGGVNLDQAGREANPHPRRSVPWGTDINREAVNLADTDDGFAGVAPVGTWPGQRRPDQPEHKPGNGSPYGVLDMSGNVQEWTTDTIDKQPVFRVVRGGGYKQSRADALHTITYENRRTSGSPYYDVGFRCVRIDTPQD